MIGGSVTTGSDPHRLSGNGWAHHQQAGGAGVGQVGMVQIHRSWVGPVETGMFDPGGDLPMDDGLLILADDIDAEFEEVLLPKLVRFRVAILPRQAATVDEGAVGRFDVPNPDLTPSIGPDLGMLPGEDLGIEVTVDGRRHGLGVGLTTDAENVGVEGHADGLGLERAIDRDQAQGRTGLGTRIDLRISHDDTVGLRTLVVARGRLQPDRGGRRGRRSRHRPRSAGGEGGDRLGLARRPRISGGLLGAGPGGIRIGRGRLGAIVGDQGLGGDGLRRRRRRRRRDRRR